MTAKLAVCLLLCTLAACGDDDEPGPDAAAADAGATVDGGAQGADAASLQPPPPGPANPGDGKGPTTFVIRSWHLGDQPWSAIPPAEGDWQAYGYDLDHRASSAASTGLCTPLHNATASSVYPDGRGGTDNNFGKLVLPILLGLQTDLGAQFDAQIAAGGASTLLFTLQSLGSGADYNPIESRVYQPATLAAPPTFDGTDVWAIDPRSLEDGNPSSPKLAFPEAYLVGNTWVASGAEQPLVLRWQLAGYPFDVTIHRAIITMELDVAHQGTMRGTIAGIVSAVELGEAFRGVAGAFDPSLCSGATVDSIVTQVESAADILLDGGQDGGKPCEGISIGLGFEATLVQLGPVGEAPLPTEPCD
jgi:hypothetical protein